MQSEGACIFKSFSEPKDYRDKAYIICQYLNIAGQGLQSNVGNFKADRENLRCFQQRISMNEGYWKRILLLTIYPRGKVGHYINSLDNESDRQSRQIPNLLFFCLYSICSMAHYSDTVQCSLLTSGRLCIDWKNLPYHSPAGCDRVK